MTINQLTECLEYRDRAGIQNILNRNSYLCNAEFSTIHNLCQVEGGRNGTRERIVFTEDGIYEITMLSSKPKAKQFRAWIRTEYLTLLFFIPKAVITIHCSFNNTLYKAHISI